MERLLRHGIFAVAAIMIAATVGAYLGRLPSLLQFAYADKVLHFTLFGLLTFFWVMRWGDGRWRFGPLRLPKAVLVPFALGASEEAAQALSWRRAADPVDLLFDLLGMVTFWWLATQVRTPDTAPARER